MTNNHTTAANAWDELAARKDAANYAATEYAPEKYEFYTPQVCGMLQVACANGYLAGSFARAESVAKVMDGLKKLLRKIKTISKKYEKGMGSAAAVFEMEDQADKALALLERLEKQDA